MNISMLVFVLFSMFGMGLALTVGEIVAPFKRIKLVGFALLSNFVVIPVLTYTISLWLELDKSLFAGLMILACCAGAPFLPALTTLAGGSLAFGVGLMTLLILVTIIYAPIVIPLAIPGVTINSWSIASPLIGYMLLPIIIGLIIKALWPGLAGLLRPFAVNISRISLFILAVLVLLMAFPSFVKAYGTGVYNATAIFVFGSFLVGYFFSGLKTADRYVMALGAGLRNVTAALLIAATNFSDKNVITVVLIGNVIGVIILFSAAGLFRKFSTPQISNQS